MKIKPLEWEKIFAKHLLDKGVVSKVHNKTE
jgi:hypothetical protein